MEKEPRHLILGVHLTNRVRDAPSVQKILTQFGCNIRTRIGLHRTDEQRCSPEGLILLELIGDDATCQDLANQLAVLTGIEVKQMVFEHPD